jgi:hypothetical protein
MPGPKAKGKAKAKAKAKAGAPDLSGAKVKMEISKVLTTILKDVAVFQPLVADLGAHEVSSGISKTLEVYVTELENCQKELQIQFVGGGVPQQL